MKTLLYIIGLPFVAIIIVAIAFDYYIYLPIARRAGVKFNPASGRCWHI